MGKHTKIEWCDDSFSPWWGCTHAGSPGCDHCYAREQDRRFGGEGGHWDGAPRRFFSKQYWHNPVRWNRRAEREGVRRRVFCGSMCDVFEDGNEGLAVARCALWDLIEATPYLSWLLLTKRPENVSPYFPLRWRREGCPPNVWLGVTAEDQQRADERIPVLLQVPAPVRFVSAEPLLGELTLTPWLTGPNGINWVIAGGESGVRARRTDPAWVLWLRDQCSTAGAPFFFKQWGRWLPATHAKQITATGGIHYWDVLRWKHGGTVREFGERYYAVGKKKSGCFLGGHRYQQFPGDNPLEKTL